MFDWWRRPSRPEAAPPARRVKTYQADSGFVYQYFSSARQRRGAGTVYRFTVSADRRSWMEVEISVPDEALAAWERRAGRGLADNERYGVAKLALFALFDRGEAVADGVRVAAAEAEAHLAVLGV